MSATDTDLRKPGVASPRCRGCAHELREVFADLGTSPLSNAYLRADDLARGEMFFPLKAWVCANCFLVQLEAFARPDEIFSDYAYFSSFSQTWLDHSRAYAREAAKSLNLSGDSLVAEIASNDGYLLQYFVEQGVPVLGVEPAQNIAEVARQRGVRTECVFFGEQSARELRERYGAANLIAANNVLAHVPDLHDFVAGFEVLLAQRGRASFEFPHLLELMRHSQFDTIYHEHFSYLSLVALRPVFERHGLAMVSVQKLATHGGSLRLWIARADSGIEADASVAQALEEEQRAGLLQLSAYRGFAQEILRVKRETVSFLIEAQRQGKRVAAYGAAAKGNTLLNYCGIRSDLVEYVVDRNPAKQGHFLPGSRIPVFSPDRIDEEHPDYLLILPWNIADEVKAQMAHVRRWGCKFVTAIPAIAID